MAQRVVPAPVPSTSRAMPCWIAALWLAAVLLPASAAAQAADPAGFPFLRLEPSARAAALGGSTAAVPGPDVNALFYNPALLDAEMHRALSLSYLNHVAGLNAGFAAYARQVDGLGTVAGGLRFLSWGEVEGADEAGASTGTFSATDAALTVGLARPVGERLRYGVGVHALTSRIEGYGASALAADLGVLYALPAHQLTLSASAHNVGVTLGSFGDTRDDLPFDLRVGAAKRLQYVPLLVSVTGFDLDDLGARSDGRFTAADMLRHVAVGGEFQFSESFQVRLGYNHRRHADLKMKSRLDLAGLGAGFGLQLFRVHVDYAYNSWSSLGGLHQFTVRTRL